jgi:hypothetical protein
MILQRAAGEPVCVGIDKEIAFGSFGDCVSAYVVAAGCLSVHCVPCATRRYCVAITKKHIKKQYNRKICRYMILLC